MEKRIYSLGTTSKIEKLLQSIPEGKLFSVSDLRECGERNTIHQVLFRAVKDGKLRRHARGLYYKSARNAVYKFSCTDVFLCKSRAYYQSKI